MRNSPVPAAARREGDAEIGMGLGVIRPEVQKVLERLKDVPIDIAPRFVTAESFAQSQ